MPLTEINSYYVAGHKLFHISLLAGYK